MKYGRTVNGEQWHIARVVDGRALCGGYPLESLVDARPERVCGNCDGALRQKGVQARKEKPRGRAPRTAYAPRHKYKDA